MPCLVHSSHPPHPPGTLGKDRAVSVNFSCDDMQRQLGEPQDVFPPVLELSQLDTLVILAQTVILIVGLCGCASTFTYIRRVAQERCPCDRRIPTLLLVFCLNDGLALLHLPAKSVTLTINHWIFGPVLCRVSLLFENGISHTFSTFLILFLIFYLRAMSFRLTYFLRNDINLTIAAVLMLLTIIIHLPVWFMSASREIVMATYYADNSTTVTSRVRYFHCSALIDQYFFLFFNIYMVIGTYIVPVALGSILLYLTLFHATDEVTKRLAACCSILFAFHLLCLSPQRLILPAYKIAGNGVEYHVIENLPSFCAALKWIVYWSLNDSVHFNCQMSSARSSIRLGERRLSELSALKKRSVYARESLM